MTKEEMKQIFLNKGLSEKYFELFFLRKPKDLDIETIEPYMVEASLIDIERQKKIDLLIKQHPELTNEQLLKLEIK